MNTCMCVLHMHFEHALDVHDEIFIQQMHINRYAKCINAKSVIMIIPGVTLDNTIDTRALGSFLRGNLISALKNPLYGICMYIFCERLHIYVCLHVVSSACLLCGG